MIVIIIIYNNRRYCGQESLKSSHFVKNCLTRKFPENDAKTLLGKNLYDNYRAFIYLTPFL